MTATELAAWWGAVVATLVFIWDFIKWKRAGPIVSVSVSPNMTIIGGPRIRSVAKIQDNVKDDTIITVVATNKGDRPTTVTHLVIRHYASMFQRLRKKPNMAGIVTNSALEERQLPHLLPRRRQCTQRRDCRTDRALP